LILAFFATALLYASVGFGGGSTYNALLILMEIDYTLVPVIALTCNLIVVSGNSLRYYKHQCIPWKFTLPVISISIPFAFIGGNTILEEEIFIKILAWTLLISGISMFYKNREIKTFSSKLDTPLGKFLTIFIAGILGFLAGLVGIGGGIFFAPILHLTQALPTRNIAAFTSIFILVNSIAGLIGQLSKNQSFDIQMQELNYIWLVIAVLIGGQIGSHLSIKRIRPIVVRQLTAVLVIYVGCRLLLI